MPVAKTIYLVRHGQSEHNISPIFQGESAILSDTGKAQAMTLATRMSQVGFETIISSPLPRAAETAEIIAHKAEKDVVHSDLFVECRKPRELDGKPHTDVAAGNLWRKWQESLQNPELRVADGENYDDFTQRTAEALKYLLDRPENTLAVVTHGHFLRALTAQVVLGDALTPELLDKFLRRISFENTGITVLRYTDAFEEEPTWRIWTLNDHSHFAE